MADENLQSSQMSQSQLDSSALHNASGMMSGSHQRDRSNEKIFSKVGLRQSSNDS